LELITHLHLVSSFPTVQIWKRRHS
jgi:hypothetical protein